MYENDPSSFRQLFRSVPLYDAGERPRAWNMPDPAQRAANLADRQARVEAHRQRVEAEREGSDG